MATTYITAWRDEYVHFDRFYVQTLFTSLETDSFASERKSTLGVLLKKREFKTATLKGE